MDELLSELLETDDEEKGDRGRVGVLGGSVDKSGSPALVGEAALRTGSDLVKVLTSERVADVVDGYSENVDVSHYSGDHLSADSVSKATELGAWGDVLVVGPGLSEPDRDAVRRVVAGVTVPLVVDADAIEPTLADPSSLSEAVVTPDGVEVGMIEDAHGSLEAFAEEAGAVVVSTGATDVIYAGDERLTNETGTPSMTVGGTGDVLAGAVASMVGQGLDRRDAARLGAWTVGRAGERAAEAYGIGMTATDVVERIPAAMGA